MITGHDLLINDPATEVSDIDLTSMMKAIRQNTPHCGVNGGLRIKVTRERVRTSIDPVGPTKRCPYSVARSNSLWHNIGIHIHVY